MNTKDKNTTFPKRHITIYTEVNPNPNSMKFMLNFMLLDETENFDYPNLESTTSSPLAKELFDFDFVERVFYRANFITITKKEDKEWEEIIPLLKPFIKEYLEEEKPVFTEDAEIDNGIDTNDTEIIKQIKVVLNEYIAPAVEMDGGAIRFESFDIDTGFLKVMLQGACSGCPSSTITLKAGIENLMKKMVPQVTEVVAEGV